MKTIITVIACSFLLIGCSRKDAQQSTSSVGFMVGASRDVIVKRLDQIHARILNDSPQLLHAEFSVPELKRPMQVELGFANGKLASVNYVPQ